MTDGVFVPWDVLAGLLIAAALTGVAGHLSGALVYTRNQFRRHKEMLFDEKTGAIPVVKRDLETQIASVRAAIPTVASIVSAIPKVVIPEVPTLGEIANEVEARLPAVPTTAEIVAALPDLTDKLNLFEEKVGQRLVAQFDVKMDSVREAIKTQVRETVQANLAGARAAFKKGLEDGDDVGGFAGDLGILGEVLGALGVDNETLTRIGRGKALYDRGKAAGGGKFDLKAMIKGQGGNGGSGQMPARVGEIRPGGDGRPWIFTGDAQQGYGGWVLIPQAAPAIPVPLPQPTPPPAPLQPAARAEPTESLPPELPPEKPVA